MADVLRIGLGVLKLSPRELYQLTPGEFSDVVLARNWAAEQSSPKRPMSPAAKGAAWRQFEELRGKHR